MGQKQSKVNLQLEQERNAAMQMQNKLFEKSLAPSTAEIRHEEDATKWRSFLTGKDYRDAPEGSMLGFDLWNPAQMQRMQEKAQNITGVGASALGGNNSIALQLARERNANEMAQSHGAAYENAIKGQDAYFKGSALPYAQFTSGKNFQGLGINQSNIGALTQGWVDTAPKPFNWGAVIGGALGAGASILSGGISQGGRWGKK